MTVVYKQAYVVKGMDISINDVSLLNFFLEQKYYEKQNFRRVPIEFLKMLNYRNYSQSTVETYHSYLIKFLNSYTEKTMEQLNAFSEEEINFYHEKMSENNNISISSLNLSINAIKFYYMQVLKKEFHPKGIIRPNKEKALPKVISKSELKLIFKLSRM